MFEEKDFSAEPEYCQYECPYRMSTLNMEECFWSRHTRERFNIFLELELSRFMQKLIHCHASQSGRTMAKIQDSLLNIFATQLGAVFPKKCEIGRGLNVLSCQNVLKNIGH